MASGRVEAQTVYLKYLNQNNTLSYKYLVSQSLGGDLSPPFLPRAMARRVVGKPEAPADLPKPQFLVVFSSWSPQASQDITT